jgi:hypothetical protein
MTTSEQRLGPGGKIAVVVCGALMREVAEIARNRDWELDLFGIPDEHHLYPARIVEAVEEKLSELGDRYDRIVVVYGDCGTGGALDRVLAEHGAVRTVGPHCYEMYEGCGFQKLTREAGTYFVTDYLVRNWERTVLPGLGLDRRPELKAVCFDGCERLVYLRQAHDPALEEKAGEIAAYLEVPLVVEVTGLDELEQRLTEAVEG